ncbi:hypothetical protein LINGRAHAP2_LOCUS2949 [Linum grandiflorum]
MASNPPTHQQPDSALTAHIRGNTTENQHPCTVAEQIAGLTIGALLPALTLTELIPDPPSWGYELCMVGVFLTKRTMNIHAIRRSLPNVWEPGRGVEVDELEGCLYLFRFEHQLDVHKVHKLPFGYFSEDVGRALGDFVGCYMEYDAKNTIAYPDAYMQIPVLLDVCMPLQKERLVTLHGGREVMCPFRYERLQTFCFICGILGHKEQQCQPRYRFPEEQLPFLWDDSIKAVSRQEAGAQLANPWLRVRNRLEPGRNSGRDAQGQERGRHRTPAIPPNIQALAICMTAP